MAPDASLATDLGERLRASDGPDLGECPGELAHASNRPNRKRWWPGPRQPRVELPLPTQQHFPTDDAVVKLLWLAICDIEDKRARAREADRGKPVNQRTAPARLIEGSITTGWRQALAALAEFCEDRNLDKLT
jgi:hypothetical protein